MELMINIVRESWHILLDSAPFILFGFFFSGLIKGFISDEMVAKHLGGSGPKAITKAALIGIPLPLCSCGVIPTAIGLRKQGAGKGATISFLISTPETGVDSIALTYALLDPLMTIFRPVAAFVTAMVTGMMEYLLPDRKEKMVGIEEKKEDGEGCCSSSCSKVHEHISEPGRWQKLKSGLDYAFGDMLLDIGNWLALGIIIAGLISALVPDTFFSENLSGGLPSMLLMLVAGIPLYICASASTPIAAALILKGISPGAALVFLLAGPATNAATITAVFRYLGRRSAIIYLAGIAVSSILLGLLLDFIYTTSGLEPKVAYAAAEEVIPFALSLGSVILLAGLYLKARFSKKGCC